MITTAKLLTSIWVDSIPILVAKEMGLSSKIKSIGTVIDGTDIFRMSPTSLYRFIFTKCGNNLETVKTKLSEIYDNNITNPETLEKTASHWCGGDIEKMKLEYTKVPKKKVLTKIYNRIVKASEQPPSFKESIQILAQKFDYNTEEIINFIQNL